MDKRFGLVVKGQEKKHIPLKSVAVSGRIKGYVFGLETKLTYLNDSSDPLEVVFRFPVDESSAVVGLEARINGRTIKGEVREKEEARQMYDDALSSGLTAALGEEKTKDIFSLALGNLPPKGEADIVLKLCGEMPLDKETEAARFSLPTVLKPRYTPAGSTDPLAAIGGEGGQVEKGSAPAVSSFGIVVDGADEVSSITSPTHGIDTALNDKGGSDVTLSDKGPLVKDLVILVQYKNPHVPRAIVEKGVEKKGNQLMSDQAVMLEFFPKFTSFQAACEFLFVVDRSGSMQGAYINSAKETLVLFLKSIPPGCYFNIIGFGSSYEHLFPSSVPYNQSNLDKAMKHANKLSADLGGTELLRPLEYVFDQKPVSGLPRQVFVLTDGSVSNTDACIRLTKKNVHVARVFTFGIGSGASTALVKGLARAGNGSSEFIKEGERLQGKVIGSLKKALQPSFTDVKLKFSVPRGVEVFQAPNKIPPVFNGEKLVLYGLLKGAGKDKRGQCSAVLKGKMLGSDVEHCINFQLEGGSLSSDMPIVHQLAAKSLIQCWENEKGSKKTDLDIIKLSVESSVVSSHTSYIAIDEEQDKPIEGAIKTYDLTADTTGDLAFTYSYMSMSPPASYCLAQSSYGSGPPMPMPPPASYQSSYGSGSPMPMAVMSGPPPPSRYARNSGPPPPPSGGFGMFNSPPPPAASFGAPPPPPSAGFCDLFSAPTPPPAPANQSNNDLTGNLVDLLFSDSSVTPMISLGISSGSTSQPDDGLTRLITLQSAEGYWVLNESLATVLGRPLSSLKGSCPSGCPEVVWGTLLSLALLETKYSSQRDEWELVSMKTEMWLQSQTLQGTTIASLTAQAKQALA